MLKWIAPLFMSGVAIFILFFLISINDEDSYTQTEVLSIQNDTIEKEPRKNWLNHFSKSERLGYFYPVNEVYVKTDLNEKIIKITTYKLSAKLLDPYQLFCLKEELKRHSLDYYMLKDNAEVSLLIYSQDVNKLNSLVNILKEYQIVAKIMPYKEEY